METFRAAASGAFVVRKMNGLILAFSAAGVRYLRVGGQAMPLTEMPRFSLDLDFFIPPRQAFLSLSTLRRNQPA